MSLSSHEWAQLLCLPGSDVLDVGCGKGEVAALFEQLGCTITGLDLDAEAVERMEELGFDAHLCDLDTDAPAKILSDQQFDVVVCLDVLEHTKSPVEVLTGLLDVLQPDGDVIISLPNVTHGDVRLALLDGQFRYGPMGLLDETHLRFFDIKSVEQLVADAGLEIRELHRVIYELGTTEIDSGRAASQELMASLRDEPEALTYQWVLRARRPEAAEKRAPFVSLAESMGVMEQGARQSTSYAKELEVALAGKTGEVDRLAAEFAGAESYVAELESSAAMAAEELEIVRQTLAVNEAVTATISVENEALTTQLAAARAHTAQEQAALARIVERRGYQIMDRVSRMRAFSRLSR